MATRAVAVGAAPGAAGISGEAGLAGVPRLLEDLARLSEDKDTADIVFLLGRDETPVYAHRIILQARSVFYSSFLDKLQLISFLRPRIISLLIRRTCEKLAEIQTMRQFTLSSFPPRYFSPPPGMRRTSSTRSCKRSKSEIGNFITARTLMHLGTKLIVNRNFY